MSLGSLEWESYSIDKIIELKENLPNNSDIPDILKQYLLYVRCLKYDEDPIYDYNIFIK